jgi:hypothetical protein
VQLLSDKIHLLYGANSVTVLRRETCKSWVEILGSRGAPEVSHLNPKMEVGNSSPEALQFDDSPLPEPGEGMEVVAVIDRNRLIRLRHNSGPAVRVWGYGMK